MVRDLKHTSALVKGILEENYAVRRTLDFMHVERLVLDKRKEKVSLLGEAVLIKCRRK